MYLSEISSHACSQNCLGKHPELFQRQQKCPGLLVGGEIQGLYQQGWMKSVVWIFTRKHISLIKHINWQKPPIMVKSVILLKTQIKKHSKENSHDGYRPWGGFFFFSFWFLGPYPWHLEVPRLGVESELQPMPQPQQHGILNPLSKAMDQTHILMGTSQVHYHWATTGTPVVDDSWWLCWNFGLRGEKC